MKKSQWLLLAIEETVQPIQLQKILFKFAKESGVPDEETYKFSPYDWGPCSFEIYADLEEARNDGLVEAVPSGRGWNMYRLTRLGASAAAAVRKRADKELIRSLHGIREWVTSRDFQTLLRDVYEAYPEYATQSLFMK